MGLATLVIPFLSLALTPSLRHNNNSINWLTLWPPKSSTATANTNTKTRSMVRVSGSLTKHPKPTDGAARHAAKSTPTQPPPRNNMHTPASKRKNRLQPGPACSTRWGSEANKRKSPRRYGKVLEDWKRIAGKSLFAN